MHLNIRNDLGPMLSPRQISASRAAFLAPSSLHLYRISSVTTLTQKSQRLIFASHRESVKTQFPFPSRRPSASANAPDLPAAPSSFSDQIPSSPALPAITPIWRLLAETAIQLTVAAFAVAASVIAKRKFFAFASAFLSVPQVIFSIRRYFSERQSRAEHPGLVFDPPDEADFSKNSAEAEKELDDVPDVIEPSPDIEVAKQAALQPLSALAVRTAIAEEVDALRHAIEQTEQSTLQREHVRNVSIAEAIASLDGGIRALRRTVETRNQVESSAPFAIVSELELVRSRFKDAEQEKNALQIRLQSAESNFEEAKRQGGRARREADAALEKELHLRTEVASLSSRLSRLEDVTDRLDRTEQENDELKEKLVAAAREKERLRQSADDAERRVLRVENISRVLREQMQSLTDLVAGPKKRKNGRDAKERLDLEAEKRFGEKRLRKPGSFGRGSLLYEELTGDDEMKASETEWPEGVLEGGRKEGRKSSVDHLPVDGGFGSGISTSHGRKQLALENTGGRELPAAASDTMFSFSRGEFDDSERGAIGRIAPETQSFGDNSANDGKPPASDHIAPEAAKLGRKELDSGSSEEHAYPAKPSEDQSFENRKNGDGIASEESVQTISDENEANVSTPGINGKKLNLKEVNPDDPSGAYVPSGEVKDEAPSSDMTSKLEGNSSTPKRSNEHHVPVEIAHVDAEIGEATIHESSVNRKMASPAHAPEEQELSEAVERTGQTGEQDGLDEHIENKTETDNEGSTVPAVRKVHVISINHANDTKGTEVSTVASNANKAIPKGKEMQSAHFGRKDTDHTPLSAEQQSVGQQQEQVSPSKEDPPTVQDLVNSADELVGKARRRGLALAQTDLLFARAVSKLEKAMSIEAGRSDIEAKLGGALLAWAKVSLANPATNARLTEALTHLESSAKARPEDEANMFNTGLCLCLLASTSRDGRAKEHYTRACEFFNALLVLNDKSRIGSFNCGLAYISLGRLAVAEDGRDIDTCVQYFETASSRFRKSLELKPGDHKAVAYLKDCERHVQELQA